MSADEPAHVATPDDPAAASPRRKGLAPRLVRVGAASYLAWCGVLFFAQGNMLFPRWLTGPAAESAPAGAERLWVTAEGGHRVEAHFYPAPAAAAGERTPAVVFTHGNGELVHQCTEIARMYNEMGLSVLIPEYRGYGNAGGSPSQDAIVADVTAFYDLLAARPEIDPAAIVLHGRSLGGGVAAQLAARRRPAALVLESTFTSIASFSWRYGVPPALVRHPFRTDRVLPTLQGVPILIMHGRGDSIVPVEHGRRLRSLAPHAEYYETDDEHMSFRDLAAYREAVRGFLDRSGLLPAGQPGEE